MQEDYFPRNPPLYPPPQKRKRKRGGKNNRGKDKTHMSFASNTEAPYFSIVLNQTHDSTKLKAVKDILC